MKESTIKILTPLLNVLRGCSVLDEVRQAAFHRNGRDFIHFHDDEEGLVADVKITGGRLRMSAVSAEDQAELMERIDRQLSALESRGAKTRSGRR